MSKLKTLKDLEEIFSPMKKVYGGEDLISANIIREEAKKWIKELNKTLEKACEKQTDGYYNDAELGKEGVTYSASAFADDETRPIIKFINQFFNIGEEK